ncbi:MAG TPA: O-antigen ligase family protein, partial [Planctomycetota bacterium]|nr:O-antigen ligase family protein [Planctomycetota bacterium]
AWTHYPTAAVFRTLELLLYVTWTLLVVTVLRRRRDVSMLLWVFLSAGVAAAAMSFFLNRFDEQISPLGNPNWLAACVMMPTAFPAAGLAPAGASFFVARFEEQFWLPIGNPNWLAACLLVPMMLALEGVVSNLFGERRRPWVAGLHLLVLALLSLVLYLTGSESAAAAFLLALVALPLLLRVRRRALISAALAAVIVLGAVVDLARGEHGKLRSFAHSKSVAIRLDMWRWSLELARRNPVSGLGAGGFLPNVSEVSARDIDRNPGYYADITVHAHNEPLEVLVELGVLGLVAFLWPVGVLLAGVCRLPREGPVDRLRLRVGAFAAGWLALFLQSFLTVGIRFWSVPVVFWTGVGLLAASMRVLGAETPSAERERSRPRVTGSRVTAFAVVLLVLVVGAWFVIVRGGRASAAMKEALDEKDDTKRIALLQRACAGEVFFVDRVRAHNALGRLYYRLHLPGAASDQFQRIVRLAGNYHDAELSAAANYLALNPVRIDLALTHLERYAKLRPAQPASANILSRYFQRLPVDEAAAEYDRLARLYPRFGKLRVAWALVVPDGTRTRELLDEALALDPDDAHALFLAALVAWKDGDFDRARAWFAECRRMGFRITLSRLALLSAKWTTGFPNDDALRDEVGTLAPSPTGD